MYIVTGGAGFIGANIVEGLNLRGESDILVVDNLEKSAKFHNLVDLEFADFLDKRDFRDQIEKGRFDHARIRGIFHQGACSDTMEYDGRYMMDNNFAYSKLLFHFAVEREIPFVYASSAATYGNGTRFTEERSSEDPLNIYGYSKLLFDRYVERRLADVESTVAGLRYFNVYGPREEHKGRMASMVYQSYRQLRDDHVTWLFQGTGGYGDGEQRRDFIYVRDVVDVNLFLADGVPVQGTFNVGTGQSSSFNEIVHTLIDIMGQGELKYKPMPDGLREKYQNFTEADITRLRRAGYDKPFTSLREGLREYVARLREE
ncbi:MAG: ADP-glyceromanno-heptose 6-epimerase [Magnetococcales bacterium]|nr:ADP-glyceromanno-heptose 6-epimerase [Magnetococcales bacterium]MBF0322358.1 ADP-glyceromanno-heptose 6-epimerase [Magnetococcales bacterium]